MAVLQLKSISKRYKKNLVVSSFDLNVERGHICGLLGPNGAGKTTIMKIMAGLIEKSSGEMRFFDSDDLDKNRKRMSFMIEEPIVDPNMNAYNNLAYIRYLRGYPDERRINEVLDIVGLAHTGEKKAVKFSLGMRQRLGIGMALMTKPEVLVLDEPINGLDPEGIVEVRQLLKKLSEEQGVTILISSHILSELAELCTDFSIINRGNLIENISSDELKTKCRGHISLRTDDINGTAALIEEKLNIHDYKVIHGEEIHIFQQLDRLRHISKTITDSGFTLTKIVEEGQSLEDYYIERIGERNE